MTRTSRRPGAAILPTRVRNPSPHVVQTSTSTSQPWNLGGLTSGRRPPGPPRDLPDQAPASTIARMSSIKGTPRRILVVLSLLLAGTALALSLLAPAPPVPGQTPLQDIQDIHALPSTLLGAHAITQTGTRS
jgi:hypothetical protein